MPVGIKSDKDGKLYLLVGDNKPMNAELAQYAAETITVEGRLVMRDGLLLIENALVKK